MPGERPRRRRSEAQRAAWRKLRPHHRAWIMAERPDEIEREQTLRDETFFALENAFGPRQWDATVAILAEGEPEGAADHASSADDDPDGLTLQAIAIELGLSRARVWQILMRGLDKMRTHPTIRELHGLRPILHPADLDLDEAIVRATAPTEDEDDDEESP